LVLVVQEGHLVILAEVQTVTIQFLARLLQIKVVVAQAMALGGLMVEQVVQAVAVAL
jgi:hypothetical protein